MQYLHVIHVQDVQFYMFSRETACLYKCLSTLRSQDGVVKSDGIYVRGISTL